MSYFKALDEMIQHTVHYMPAYTSDLGMIVPAQNESDYLLLRDEINEHMHGTLDFTQLSPVAFDIMCQWEELMSQQAEESEEHY